MEKLKFELGESSEETAGTPSNSFRKENTIVTIRRTRVGSLKVIDEENAEDYDVGDASPPPRSRRRKALNSPFSHEQITDSCNSAKYATHLGQNICLFLVTFVLALIAALMAALYKEEIIKHLG